jgi:ArsR family transcriptional regulator, arsenate/arsenite/antimonite-responsive transcriptional repressor
MGEVKHSVELSERQMQLIAKALADSNRYEILRKVASCKSAMACSDMRECIDITPATLSHHMKELETAGLIRSEKAGKFVNYFAETRVLRAYLDRLRADLA